MYYFNPIDWLFILPGLLLGMWAQWKVSHAFNTYSKVPTRAGAPAWEVAQTLLSTYGNQPVAIKPIQGRLTDHYNPKDQSLGLSQGVYDSASVAAIAIAAHETGHAMQDQSDYGPLRLRTALVPVVNAASYLYMFLFFLGFIFSYKILLDIGIVVFALSFLFALATLPVEFNASRRALAMLGESNLLTQEELPQAKSVLTAAALTYVAAAITALLQLLRLLLYRGRSRE